LCEPSKRYNIPRAGIRNRSSTALHPNQDNAIIESSAKMSAIAPLEFQPSGAGIIAIAAIIFATVA
jgi:hypothetical protein